MRIKFVSLIILTLLSFPAFSELQISNDWFWDLSLDNGEYVYAATYNGEGRILGQYCYLEEGNCIYIVSFGTVCDQGKEYPSILNSPAGVTEVRLICGHVFNGENVFYIKPFDDVDNLIKLASKVGFVIAMEADEFKVVRFSLAGSTHAIKMMRSGAEYLRNGRTKSNLSTEEYL